MAAPTRFYLSRSTAAPVTPAGFAAAWGQTVNAETYQLSRAKQNAALGTETSTNYAETSAAVINVLHARTVSGDAFAGGEVLSGLTFSAVISCAQDLATADASLQIVVRVITAAGAAVSTLYAGHSAALTATVGAVGEEMASGTRATRIMSAVTLADHTAAAGERLVVEWGVRFHNTIATSVTAYFNRGDPTATADFDLTSGLTASLCPWVEFSDDPFNPAAADPPQYARPDSTVAAGTWTDAGGGTTLLWAGLDEVAPDDADYVQGVGVYETGLTDVTDPAVSAGHVVRYRYAKTGAAAVDLEVRLMQGATTVATWTHPGVAAAWVTAAQTLTAGQADAITDYNDLRLRFNATVV